MTARKKIENYEKSYDWLSAVKVCSETLQSKSLPNSSKAEIWEKIGVYYSKASRQADNHEKFRERRQLAFDAYKKAAKLFQPEESPEHEGKSTRCNALAEYVSSWLAPNAEERRRRLDECWSFSQRSLKLFKKRKNLLYIGKTCNDLLTCLLERLYVATDWADMKKVVEEGVKYVDEAIEVLSKLKDEDELLRAYSLGSLQSWYTSNNSEDEKERKKHVERSIKFSEESLRLSKVVGNPAHAALSYWAAAFCNLLFKGDVKSAIEYSQKMLKQAEILRDNLLKGVAFYTLTFTTFWLVRMLEDPEKKMAELKRIIQFGEEALHHLQIFSQDFFIAETYCFYAETYSILAREVLIKTVEKQAMLRKALDIGRQGLEYAVRSGSPDATGSTLHALSKALHYSSSLVEGRIEKKQLLEEALIHREEYIKLVKKAFPSNSWILGVGQSYEGLIKAELARVEPSKKSRETLFESAVSDLEEGVANCRKWVSSRQIPTLLAAAGLYEDWLGKIYNEFYLLTERTELLHKANVVYSSAAEKFKTADMPSRVAEGYWKIARNQDRLGDFEAAVKSFERAYEEYRIVMQKIPNFSDFFSDYAMYMKAWSEIERGKTTHSKREYMTAKLHYEKTAQLLGQTTTWNHLATNFLAWSILEEGEYLSRDEKSVEAHEAFARAGELFNEAKETLKVALTKNLETEERSLIDSLIEASYARRKYCFGRVAVEEAIILDREGDYLASSKKFSAAAEILKQTAEMLDYKELQPIIHLCFAWEKMMIAEANASPAMYQEAAELFQQAREYALDQSTSMLALAHSSFCKALKAGTEFEINRKMTSYSVAKSHLEAAGNYYLKSGFKTASEYAKATAHLFDAYIYMDKAKVESDPETKTKFFMMAEKVLGASAASYLRAKHKDKQFQVQQLLEKVREDRELAVSLSEILRAPNITSSTSSFTTPTPSEVQAVGLERFEQANIQAKLVREEGEINVGEILNLEMQIVNVGKEPVSLVKIEGFLPESFESTITPSSFQRENSTINMKGKRLEPLGTENVKLGVKTYEEGTFEISPKIFCVDDAGRQITSEIESATVKVKQTVLENRVNTGYDDLNKILFGGIPINYSVVLTSPSCDERDILIKRFLEAGIKEGEIVFYITAEPGGIKDLAETHSNLVHLFICNPQASKIAPDKPNIYKLKGVENLTDLTIALTSAFRRLDTEKKKRACIEIVSDILLQHHAVQTRRWLTGLIPELRAAGFTTVAVLNPLMHPSQEVHAIISLFEGEINIHEHETEKGSFKFLKIKKMYNQKYLESELQLKKIRLTE